MSKQQNQNEQGAVALITAMIVSVLLMITTAGMVTLTLKSLRQSTDGAQSTKAYYAAEGGLEDALYQLRNNPNYTGNNCPAAGTSNSTSAASGAVTCIKVDNKPNQLTGEVGANKTVQLDLSSLTTMKILKVEWGVKGAYDANSIPNYYTSTGVNQFPADTPASWPITAPAIMELGMVQYPAAEPFSIASVNFYEHILAPQSKKAGAAAINNGFNSTDYKDAAKLGKPFIVTCNAAWQYQCAAGFNAMNDGHRFVLRLKARYNDATYRITAQDANGNPIAIAGAMYTIDVTARAGDTFRRVQTSFATNAVPKALDGLDYVLYSDTDICKSFQIKGGGGATSLDTGLSCVP